MLWRKAINSASVCAALTIATQFLGRGTGQPESNWGHSPVGRQDKLDQAHASARRTSLARKGLRST